jgi:voltage-gated sodium channel
MKKIVGHFYKESLILCLILVNTAVIYLHSFDALAAYSNLFEFIDHVFTVYFLTELVVKILWSREGIIRSFSVGIKDYFTDPWHKVDFFAIICSVPSLILVVFSHITFFEFFVVFRALRIFKLIRVIEFIPNANEIARSVFVALRSISFIIISFMIYTTIVSLINVSLFKHNSPQYFTNGFESFFTTFKIFSGDGFSDVANSVAANASPLKVYFAKFYFVLIVMTGSILGLSLINSVFIEEMNRKSKDTVEKGLNNIGKMYDKVISMEEKILDLEKKNNELLEEIRKNNRS